MFRLLAFWFKDEGMTVYPCVKINFQIEVIFIHHLLVAIYSTSKELLDQAVSGILIMVDVLKFSTTFSIDSMLFASKL